MCATESDAGKGIVFDARYPGTRFALQAVGRRVEILELGGWGERMPRSRLVAIGSRFDAAVLSELFDQCLSPG